MKNFKDISWYIHSKHSKHSKHSNIQNIQTFKHSNIVKWVQMGTNGYKWVQNGYNENIKPIDIEVIIREYF